MANYSRGTASVKRTQASTTSRQQTAKTRPSQDKGSSDFRFSSSGGTKPSTGTSMEKSVANIMKNFGIKTKKK